MVLLTSGRGSRLYPSRGRETSPAPGAWRLPPPPRRSISAGRLRRRLWVSLGQNVSSMAVRRISLGFLAFALALTAPCWARPGDDAVRSPVSAKSGEASSGDKDEWHKVFLAGQLAGHMHVSERRLENGGFSSTLTQKLVLKRDTTVLETEATSTVEEDRNGRIVGFTVRQRLSSQASEVVGKLEGKEFALSEDDGSPSPGGPAKPGEKKPLRLSRMPADSEAVGPHRMDALLQAKLHKPGDSLELKIFIPELRKFGIQKSVLEVEEIVDLGGSKPKLRRVRSTIDALPDIPTIQWVDADGNLQKSSLPLLGTELTTVRTTMAEVLKSSLTSPPEIFLSTSVPVKGKVNAEARQITFRITGKKDAAPFQGSRKIFPAAGEEEVRPGTASERWLRVRRVAAPEGIKLPIAPQPELDEYLRPSAYVQSDDETIQRAAKKAIAGETDAVAAALKLESWVHSTIERKNLSTAFASAAEALAQREGDCTEHAVLLAALLRAVGIPSRVVAGLVHYDGVFYGHMWTEAYLGTWIPLDATQAKGSVGPDHIALSVSSLDSATVAGVFLDIVPVIGNVTIEVVESGG